jgi:hypothetical protein
MKQTLFLDALLPGCPMAQGEVWFLFVLQSFNSSGHDCSRDLHTSVSLIPGNSVRQDLKSFCDDTWRERHDP